MKKGLSGTELAGW